MAHLFFRMLKEIFRESMIKYSLYFQQERKSLINIVGARVAVPYSGRRHAKLLLELQPLQRPRRQTCEVLGSYDLEQIVEICWSWPKWVFCGF